MNDARGHDGDNRPKRRRREAFLMPLGIANRIPLGQSMVRRFNDPVSSERCRRIAGCLSKEKSASNIVYKRVTPRSFVVSSFRNGKCRRLGDQSHSGRLPAIQVVRTSSFIVNATMSARAPALSVPRSGSIPKNRAGTSDAARSASSREIPTSVTAFLTADAKSR